MAPDARVFSALEGRRILVTGASGFIGSAVTNMAAERRCEVHSVFYPGTPDPDNREWAGDLARENDVREIIKAVRPEGIIHLAAAGVSYGSSTVEEILQTNLVGLALLLETLSSFDLRPSLVLAGSGFEYALRDRPLRETDPLEPLSAYAVSKAACAMLARLYASRLPITVLRLFGVYGPGEKEPRLVPYVIGRAKRGQPVELTAGEQMRDYAYVGDIAEAFWRALAAPPSDGGLRILNVASGRALTLRAFVEILAEELRRRGVIPELRFGSKPYRPDEIMNYTADIRLLEAELGWRPATGLEQGLARTVDALL